MKRALVAIVLLAIPAAAQNWSGHWALRATREGETWQMAIDIGDEELKSVTVDFTDLGSFGVAFAASRTADGIRLERTQPAGGSIILELTRQGDRIEGTFSGLGLTAPLVATRGESVPPAIREEKVVFQNGAVTLAGTVLIPATRPVAGIVVVHGSGAVDRNSAAYRSDGIFYARLGLATLIYDKRGTGESTGDYSNASMEELADDGIAGVRLLKERYAIPVGMSGVSQGGWIAPLAATRASNVAFVICISPAAINPMEQSIFHTSNVLRKAGYSQGVIDQAATLRRRMYEWVRTGRADPGLAKDLDAVHEQPWFAQSSLPNQLPTVSRAGERAFLLFEPMPVWKKLNVPVLALWGGEDIQVPAPQSKAAIEAALSGTHHADHTLVLYPRGDHNLLLPRDPSGFPRVVSGYRPLIAEWIREHE